MSIRFRAILLLWSIEGGTLIVIILASTGYLYHDGLGDIEGRASDTIQILRNGLTEPMISKNYLLAEYVARTAFDEILVLDRITVTNEEGEVVADYQRMRNTYSNRHLRVSSPVFLADNCFGVVDVIYSTEYAIRDAQEHAIVLAAFALIGMSLSGVAAWYTLSRWAATISTVQQGINRIASGDAPEEFITYNKDNELGRLVYSYNKLINQMHRRGSSGHR